MKLKLFGMKRGLPIMEEKENKVLQAVMCHIISYIKVIPLAAPLAQTQSLANGASGFCLRPSMQLQIGLNTVCKEKATDYQTYTTIRFAAFVCTKAKLAQAVQTTLIGQN